MKSRIVYILLALFLGFFGMHCFYVKNKIKGMVYFICGTIITLRTVMIWPEINHVSFTCCGIALLWDICDALFMWEENVNNNNSYS